MSVAIGTILFSLGGGFFQPLLAASKYDKLHDWLKKNNSEVAFQRWQEFIQWKQDKEKTALSISAGLTSDSGGGALGFFKDPLEFFKGLVTVGVKVDRGIYPDELGFNFKSQMEVQKTGLKEYVSAMTLSYERYLCKYFEVFGFFERFANSYLHLNQRYEIGVGAKGEWNPTFDREKRDEVKRFRSLIEKLEPYLAADIAVYEAIELTYCLPQDKEKSIFDTIKIKAEELFNLWRDTARETEGNGFNWKGRILSTLQEIEKKKLLENLLNGVPSDLKTELDDLCNAYDQLRQMEKAQEEVEIAVEKLTTNISLGLSTAFFYETDSSQADWQETEIFKPAPASFALPPEQRFRLSVRPSLALKPYPGLELYLAWYIKLPLFGKNMKSSYVVFNDKGEINYDLWSQKKHCDARHDVQFTIKYEPSLDWAANLAISLEYDFSYDVIPPYLDSSVIKDAVLTRSEFIDVDAADLLAALKKDQSHGQAKINIGISF
ncbi:MAG: hypothetical protein WCB96_08325 [Candidatus Aminicenantales bacterium]